MLAQDIQTIRQVLTRERAWRESVFSGDRKLRKVAEIDCALQALQRIEDHLTTTGQILVQGNLFDLQEVTQ